MDEPSNPTLSQKRKRPLRAFSVSGKRSFGRTAPASAPPNVLSSSGRLRPQGAAMIEFGHATHVGLRRAHNEDTYWADGALGLWLVADGMGGHEYGEVASAIARDTLVREVGEGRSLSDAIRAADEAIISLSQRRKEALPMGTTIAALRVQDGAYEVAWVGDSRVYLWQSDALRQLSHDHS